MKHYTSWSTVPPHLKTKTQLSKLGLCLAKAQPVVALFSGGYGKWNLYDMSQAEAKRESTPAQLAALERAREIGIARRTCIECGAVFSTRTKLRYGKCAACRRAENP